MAEKVKRKQNQPKKHAGKSKPAVALRRKKIIKAITDGKTRKEAGIKAGLSPKTAESQVSQILSEPKVRSEFQKLLDNAIPDSELSVKYKELLNSKKCISAMVIAPNGEGMKDANSMTRDFVEVDDCAVQLKAADSISKLKGHLSDKHDVNLTLPITVVVRKFTNGNNPSE
jgi:DNA-binding CsgD family transcriptional regulator